MDMVPGKAKLAKLKTKRLKLPKSPSASINMRLLKETVIPALRHKHHLNPVVPRITRNKNFNKKFEWNNIIVSFISLTFLLFLIFIPLNTIEIHAIGNDTVILCVDKNVNTYYTL